MVYFIASSIAHLNAHRVASHIALAKASSIIAEPASRNAHVGGIRISTVNSECSATVIRTSRGTRCGTPNGTGIIAGTLIRQVIPRVNLRVIPRIIQRVTRQLNPRLNP